MHSKHHHAGTTCESSSHTSRHYLPLNSNVTRFLFGIMLGPATPALQQHSRLTAMHDTRQTHSTSAQVPFVIDTPEHSALSTHIRHAKPNDRPSCKCIRSILCPPTSEGRAAWYCPKALHIRSEHGTSLIVKRIRHSKQSYASCSCRTQSSNNTSKSKTRGQARTCNTPRTIRTHTTNVHLRDSRVMHQRLHLVTQPQHNYT
jgi:hypothetical protein